PRCGPAPAPGPAAAAGAARDRHPRGDPLQRRPPAAAAAGGRAGPVRSTAGGPGRAGRVPDRLPARRAAAHPRRTRGGGRHGDPATGHSRHLRLPARRAWLCDRRRLRRGRACTAWRRADQGRGLPARAARPAGRPWRRWRLPVPVHRQVRAGASRGAGRTGRPGLGRAAAPAAPLRQRRRIRAGARALPRPRPGLPPPPASRTTPPPGTTRMNDRPLRLGFVVNDVATEQDNYTTIRLARRALALGHSVALIGLEGFIYDQDGVVRAKAHVPGGESYADDPALLADLQAEDATVERINVEALDVLMLRSDPAEELV